MLGLRDIVLSATKDVYGMYRRFAMNLTAYKTLKKEFFTI